MMEGRTRYTIMDELLGGNTNKQEKQAVVKSVIQLDWIPFPEVFLRKALILFRLFASAGMIVGTPLLL